MADVSACGRLYNHGKPLGEDETIIQDIGKGLFVGSFSAIAKEKRVKF